MSYLRWKKGGKGGKMEKKPDSNLKKADICGFVMEFLQFCDVPKKTTLFSRTEWLKIKTIQCQKNKTDNKPAI